MARMKTMKVIDDKIKECEERFQKLKVRCDKVADELDALYEEKSMLENQELIEAIKASSRSKAEILAFLESHV